MKIHFLLLPLLLAIVSPGFSQTPTEEQRTQAYYHFSKARVLDEQGQWGEAISEYKKALEYDPTNSLIYSEMAQTYANNRRIRDAVEAAQRAIQYDRDNIEAHKLLSQIYLQTMSAVSSQRPSLEIVDNAIREFEEVVRIDPAEEQSFLMLGRLYQIKGDRAKAVEIFKKYISVDPSSEEGVTGLAKLQLDAGNEKEAAELLENFVKDHPSAGEALQTLGEAYSQLQEFEKAAEVLKRAMELDPENIEIKKSRAQALFFSDQFEESAGLYQGLLREEPNDGLSMLRLGQILRRQMKYSEARKYLTTAGQSFPESMEVQFNLVLLDRDQGLLEDAVKRATDLLKKSEKSDGKYTEGEKQNRRVFLMQLALLQSTMGNYDLAIRSYTDLKAITPEKDGRIDALIVDTYRDAKNLEKAIEYCQKALLEAPDSQQLQMVHADLIAERGRIDEGIRALQKLSKGTPEDLVLFSTMTNIYSRAKRFGEAQDVLNSAMQKFPNEEQVYFLQGSLFERQKKYGDAEKAFRKALELEKDSPAVLNYLGYMLADRGEKLEEAEEMILKAVESDPVNGAYLDSLGWVYFRQNRLELAEENLKRALIFANSDATIHDHLGDLYFKTKRYAEAQAEWRKSVQLGTDPEEIEKVKKKLDDVKTRVARK